MTDPRWPHLAPLRVNLGCAIYYKPGWLNLDAQRWPGCEAQDFLLADLRAALPFPDGSVDEAYAGHVLEHLPKPLLLVTELRRVLAPGARCGLVVPSADAAWRRFKRGELGQTLLTDIVGRLEEGEYGHHNVWSQGALEALCHVAGFTRMTPLDVLRDSRLTGAADWQAGVDVWR